ncbi:hypothetical protein V9T40_011494 [Parthenolecanium corni]|uniref:SOCS box domain-containing protein n=1 Tax=Parthenolecanium corni TaxID=536013 RepID=A0AAN9XZJ8_9HEMI
MSDPSSDDTSPDFFNYTDGALTGSISQAIRQNDTNTLRQLLKKRKKNPLPLSADNRKWTALHVAASKPQFKECLELLIEYRDNIILDIDGVTFLGETALHIACRNGCEESVLILLQNGCDPYIVTLEEESALHIAVDMGNSKMVSALMDYPKNINCGNWQRFTPLHEAVLGGHVEIISILLANKARVFVTDCEGNLPLHWACSKRNFDIVRRLVESDLTTINVVNFEGITPLMMASKNHDVEDVRFLLENGAKMEICDKYGRMALHFAADQGNAPLLQFLLDSTDESCIEKYLLEIRLAFEDCRDFISLVGCTICSGSVECLEVLVSSKLPKNFLQIPLREHGAISFPLTLLFDMSHTLGTEKLNSYLHLLLKHKITMVEIPRLFWGEIRCPFSRIVANFPSFSEQQHYFNLLNANDITIDYNLKYYHDNSLPFSDFSDYLSYYTPILDAIFEGKMEIVKLLVSDSVILEPDKLICNVTSCKPRCMSLMSRSPEKYREMYRYLISLKPIYYMASRARAGILRFPSPGEEFSTSKLKQLCRSTIRDLLRDHTIEDNLSNFKKKIMELPLPPSLKDYLLFKIE